MYKFYYNFASYAPTAVNGDANPDYAVANLLIYDHTKQHFRSANLNATEAKLNFGAVKAPLGLFLNDVNFVAATIKGGPDGAAWPWSLPVTITMDEKQGRYNAFIALSGLPMIDLLPAMVSNNSPAPYVTSSTLNVPGYEAYKAFDKILSSMAICSVDVPFYLMVDHGANVSISRYGIYVNPSFLGRHPKTWLYQESANGVDWSTIDTRNNQALPVGEWIFFDTIGATAKRYHRIYVTAIQTPGSPDPLITEMSLYGMQPDFNYQYLDIVPSGPTTDGAGYYRIGTVACPLSLFEFTKNPSYPDRRRALRPEPIVNRFRSGREKISRGSRVLYSHDLGFNMRAESMASEYWRFNRTFNEIDPFIFRPDEAGEDAAVAYMVQKEKSIELSRERYNRLATDTISLVEVD